jgi:hypothetical protein
MKKIAVMFGFLTLATIIAIPIVGSVHYSPGNSSVERNVGAFIADGSPRPPFQPIIVADGSPRPPFPPVVRSVAAVPPVESA